MTSSIVQTHEALRAENPNPMWLWSMMLTRGLSWDNVWEVYCGGIMDQDGINSIRWNNENFDKVPGLDFLRTLPSSPANAAELFHRVVELLPHLAQSVGYSRLDAHLETFIDKMGPVECSPTFVRQALTAFPESTHERYPDVVDIFLTKMCTSNELKVDAFRCLVEMKHPCLYSAAVAEHLHDFSLDALMAVWKTFKNADWPLSSRMDAFYPAFMHSRQAQDHPDFRQNWLATLSTCPALVDNNVSDAVSDIAKSYPDDATVSLLKHDPWRFLAFHMQTERTVKLSDVLEMFALHEDEEGSLFSFRSTVKLYCAMSPQERDSPQAKQAFAKLFAELQPGMALWDKDDELAKLKKCIKDSPTGSLSAPLALYACTHALPGEESLTKIQPYRILFGHDPRTKTGQAAFVQKYLPEFKDWLPMVQGLGLGPKEAWALGLAKLTGAPDQAVEHTIDDNLFSSAV